MGYKEDLAIDFLKLDECWAEQPILYMEYGEKHTEALKERDRIKEDLDRIKGRLFAEIKSGSKLSDAATNAEVSQELEVIEKLDELLKANHEVNILGVARTAFEHRKRSLTGLTQLYISNYFSMGELPKKVVEGLTMKVREAVRLEQSESMQEALVSEPRMRRLIPND